MSPVWMQDAGRSRTVCEAAAEGRAWMRTRWTETSVVVREGVTMNNILGIDVAKARVDVVLLVADQAPVHAQFDNTAKGFKQLKRWLVHHGVQTLHACMEATGNFSDGLATFLHRAGY